MLKLKLTSSSYLVPKNKNWSNLSGSLKYEFSPYGNWHEELLYDKSEILSINLFLDDFLSSKNLKVTDTKENIKNFLKLLKIRIKKQDNNIIIGYCSNNNDNLIYSAKFINEKKIICNWFMEEIYKLAKKNKNLFIIDFDKEFAFVGLNSCIDKRNWYFAHSYLSNHGIKIVASSLNKIIHRIYNPASKVLVLDCDNTLWGGVIGEDGINNIKIGQDGEGKIFEDFQKVIKNFITQGVIITILSKNNEHDVWNVFQSHTSMVLRKKDIVSWKIDWNEKYKNIKAIAKELDLGLDSFVFWDDNPIERDQMKRFVPEVVTVDVPDDISSWPDLLKNLDQFSKFNTTKEDKNKTNQYFARAKFIRDKDTNNDKINYLKSINLSAKKINVNNTNINRAEQINLKTNQYNLRTKKYTNKEIKKFNNINNKYCFLGSLKDNYGDHGIVGSVYLSKVDNDVIFLDNLVMSCRVIGRYYESWLINEAIKISLKKYKYIIGQYLPTEKNVVVKNFFKENNFKLLKRGEYNINYNKIYELYGKQNLYIGNLNKMKINNIEIYE